MAGATLPTIALTLLGIYSRNLAVIAFAIIFGFGHIGTTLARKHEATAAEPKAPVG